MGYKELIEKVKQHSGLSEDESKDALEMLVESMAVHLPESERLVFANQLPARLQDLALSVMATAANSQENILHQFMAVQKISQRRARRQVLAAWAALKEHIKGRQYEEILTRFSSLRLAKL